MVDFNVQFVGVAVPVAHQLYLIIGTSSSGHRGCCTSLEAVSSEEGRIETRLKESLSDGFDEGSPCECLAILFAEERAVVRATPKPASSMAHSTVTRALALWAHT